MATTQPSAESTTQTSHIEALLRRIRAGDEAAKAELIGYCYRRVERLTRSIVRGKSPHKPTGATEDVLSLSYAKFAAKFLAGMDHDFENSRSMFAYLSTVIGNTAIDEARRRTTGKHATQFPRTEYRDDLAPAREGASHEVETRIRFHERIEGLSEEDRDLVTLKFYLGYNDCEIAAISGVRRQTIPTRLNAIMLTLRGELDDAT